VNIIISQPKPRRGDPDSWPTPPANLMEYKENSERHLIAGQREYQNLVRFSLELGFDVNAANRVLDFGCSNGRITRWFERANQREIWGTDIQSTKVLWAQENLGPPLRFMVNTAVPHLPFGDRYFQFIFALSIFTHIQELHVAWLMELCRLLRPGGALYVTLHDAACMASPAGKTRILEGRFKGIDAVVKDLSSTGFLSMNAYKDDLAQVYISAEYLRRILPPWIEMRGPVVAAYADVQSAYLLVRSSK
jgi:SAM-dependent methyltransferase